MSMLHFLVENIIADINYPFAIDIANIVSHDISPNEMLFYNISLQIVLSSAEQNKV